MPLYEALIPSRYAQPLLALITAASPEALRDILTETGLHDLVQPGASTWTEETALSIRQFGDLLIAASRYLQRTDLGFELGKRITIEHHGSLGTVLAGCATMEQLLMTAERYYNLITPCFRAHYVRGKAHCQFVIRVMAPLEQEVLHMLLELHAVSTHCDLQRLLGSTAGVTIELSCPAPAHIERYAALRETRFQFSSGALPEVRTLLPASLVHKALPRSGGEQIPAGALPRTTLREAEDYGRWVELMLREAEAVQPTLEQLAALLSISPRSLTRKLGNEGIDLRQLAMRVRHERACRMLSGTTQTQSHIAYRLGYADESGFVRAFQKMEGIPPGKWRSERR